MTKARWPDGTPRSTGNAFDVANWKSSFTHETPNGMTKLGVPYKNPRPKTTPWKDKPATDGGKAYKERQRETKAKGEQA
jgi:hypothetical protein